MSQTDNKANPFDGLFARGMTFSTDAQLIVMAKYPECKRVGEGTPMIVWIPCLPHWQAFRSRKYAHTPEPPRIT